jgi:hypothetical protein
LSVAAVLGAAVSAEGVVVVDVERTIDAMAFVDSTTFPQVTNFLNDELSHTGVTSGSFPSLAGAVTTQLAPDRYATYSSQQDVSVATSDGDSIVSGSGSSSGTAVVPDSYPPPMHAGATSWEPDWGGGVAQDPWFPDYGNDIRVHFDLAASTDYLLDVTLNAQATGQPGSIGFGKVWLSPYSDAFEQSGGPHNVEYNESYFASGNPADTIHASGTLPPGRWTLLVTIGTYVEAAIPTPPTMGFNNSAAVDHTFSFTLYGDASQSLIPEPTALLVWSLLAGLSVGLAWRRRP